MHTHRLTHSPIHPPMHRTTHPLTHSGYTPLTWLLVAHLACSGLIVAWLLKYSDSITKIQATSVSLFLTAVISAAWLGTVISLNMILGMMCIASSLFMYHGLFPQAMWRTPRRFKG